MESAKSSVLTEPSQALTPAAPFPSFPLDKTGCGSALTLLPTLVSASPLDVSLFYLLSRKPVLSHTPNLTRGSGCCKGDLDPVGSDQDTARASSGLSCPSAGF